LLRFLCLFTTFLLLVIPFPKKGGWRIMWVFVRVKQDFEHCSFDLRMIVHQLFHCFLLDNIFFLRRHWMIFIIYIYEQWAVAAIYPGWFSWLVQGRCVHQHNGGLVRGWYQPLSQYQYTNQ
jgi:hypothetical protein